MTTAPAGGFDSERLDGAGAVLRGAIEAGVFPACAAAVGIGRDTVWQRAFGTLEPESSHAAALDTSYDLASLTKPLACASSIMVLLEAGELCMTDEVRRFLSGQALPHLRGVTLAHLLTHTSGLPAWQKLYGGPAGSEEILTAILETPLEAAPGARYAYSDLGYILLGEVTRRAGGQSLDRFTRDRIFRPLGMRTAGYWPIAEGEASRFTGLSSPADAGTAPTRHCPMREGRTLVAEVHDANAAAMGGVSGHAGLFGTVADVATFLQMLLDGGRAADGTIFLSGATVRLVTRPRIEREIGGQSFGWFTPPNGMHVGGDLWSDVGFSHSGFTGTSAFADPESGVWVALLTNAVYCGTGEHLRVRRLFHNRVAAAFESGPAGGR